MSGQMVGAQAAARDKVHGVAQGDQPGLPRHAASAPKLMQHADSCQREYAPYFKPGTLQKYPNELSAQELHTLVYCRWHLYKPSVVVCVKPFHSVDKKLDEISRFFIELLCKKGCAVLILANNALEGELTCKKIVINQKNAPLHPKNAL